MVRSKIGKSRRTLTTSSGAGVLTSALEVARQAREQRARDGRAGAFVRDLAEHVVGEGVNEQVARLAAPDPARAQVEQRRLVETADRRPVRAPDVVRVDLELRARVD